MNAFLIAQKRMLFVFILFLASSAIFSQTYILNEDFSSATETTAPDGWSNITVTGEATDLWNFNNPGGRIVNYPAIGNVAIFDATAYSDDSSPEEVTLESKYVDCSGSANILLMFHHWLVPTGVGIVEVWDGVYWNQVAEFTDSTSNVEYQVINVSSYVGGISDAKVRFRWTGDGEGWWAIDNFKVYAPLALDAALQNISNPKMPFQAGIQNIDVDVSNLGITTITSLNLNWEINGVVQTPFNWTGTLALGEVAEGVTIGSHSFADGEKVNLRVWLSDPNGQADMNAQNDELLIALYGSLSGVYTIGGVSPDFIDFTEAVTVLNTAGIVGPVDFMVRDGYYDEQIVIGKINGSGPTNPIRFIGESGDSSAAMLRYNTANSILDYALKLDGAEYISFETMGFERQSNDYIIWFSSGSHNISFNRCLFLGDWRNIFSDGAVRFNDISFTGSLIQARFNFSNITDFVLSDNRCTRPVSLGDIDTCLVQGNYMQYQFDCSGVRDLLYTENNCKSINLTGQSGDVRINKNIIQGKVYLYLRTGSKSELISNEINALGLDYGVYIRNRDTYEPIEVSRNKIYNVSNQTGIISLALNAIISNNFIQTDGLAQAIGIQVNAQDNLVVFNSINNLSTNQSSQGIVINNGTGQTVKNNIVSTPNGGIPIEITVPLSGCDIDYNNYHTTGTTLGRFSGIPYSNLDDWGAAIGGDANSIAVNPFYSSDTELTINHTKLWEAGDPITGIEVDIDSLIRDAATPDIGARSYLPCSDDAGIDVIAGIGHSVQPGVQDIRAALRNHGTNTLTTVTIQWSVNGQAQALFDWTGSLTTKQVDTISIGLFDFKPGELYTIGVWTENPNGVSDCNPVNNQTLLENIATPLSGVYTIGGVSPDFIDFTEAVTVLNTAGIVGPVDFMVRDGYYDEQIVIGKINGSGPTNPIRFIGESGDSSAAMLRYNTANSILDYALKLDGAEYISFETMGFERQSNDYIIWFSSGSHNISFNRCLFLGDWRNIFSDGAVRFNDISFTGSLIQARFNFSNITDFVLSDNRCTRPVSLGDIDTCLVQGNYMQYQFDCSGVRDLLYTENNCKSINLTGQSGDVRINKNIIQGKVYLYLRTGSKSELISNEINALGLDYGVYIRNRDTYEPIEVSRNKIYNVSNQTGIISLALNAIISNNFIQTDGLAQAIGIQINAQDNLVAFNSINNLSTNQSSQGIVINNGTGQTIKNNIVSTPNGGIPIEINTALSGCDIDYNNYHTTGTTLGRFSGTPYSSLPAWGAAIGGDANSTTNDPLYETDTELRPFQRYINGAGVPVGNVLLDIDGEIRNDAAPDMGADEFIADFGITRLISPTLQCDLSSDEPVTVNIRQFGDIPFQDLIVAYQINGGFIYYDTIPGSINNDIEHSFPDTEDLSSDGVYSFKIWLANANDDNNLNDTLHVERYKKPSPVVDFTFITACALQNVQFYGTANVSPGSIDHYEWDFGDEMLSDLQNPTHIYELSETYTVNFKAYSNEGCYSEAIKDVTITTTPVVEFSAESVCFGDEVEFLNTTTVQEGTLTYEWNFGDGSNTDVESPMHLYSNSGKYIVELQATAESGCSVSRQDTVEVYETIEIDLTASLDTVWVEISGGVEPYSILWEDGSTSTMNTDLNRGWHSVTVSDSKNCSAIDSIEVTIPYLLTNTVGTDASCMSCADGTATVTVIQGVAPFYYLWSNGATTPGVSGLLPGKYFVTVRDAYLDAWEDSVVIDGLTSFTISSQPTHVTCYNGSDGAIDLTLTDGLPPYDILWSNGSTDEDLNYLSAGTYSVIVTDANSQTNWDTININQPEAWGIALETYDVSCHSNCNGVAMASVLGGQAPYTYEWSNGETEVFQLNLCPGNYGLTVTDAVGCKVDTLFTLNEPDPITLALTPQDVTCGGAADGTVTSVISGGTLPYSFNWDNGDTTQNLTDIPGGLYSLTATDANGCMEFDIVPVQEPDSILVYPLITSTSCSGDSDGSIDLTVFGGEAPFEYMWSTGVTSKDISGLSAGVYSVTATDITGCSAILGVHLTEPLPLGIGISVSNPLCAGEANGTANAEISGGTIPYSYNWSNGATTALAENLTEGTYNLTATDANGCQIIGSAELIDPEALSLQLTFVDPTCEGICDGTLISEVTGGIAPYSYSWNTGASTPSLENLCEGFYELTVTDANGCTAVLSSELHWITQVTGTIDVSDVSCEGMCNGYAIAIGSGGDGSFTYEWSDGQSGSFLNNLCTGSYSVSIKDGKGCELILVDTIKSPEQILVSGNASDSKCKDKPSGSIILEVSGGKPEYTYQWNNGETTKDLSGISSGHYIVTVNDANGCNAVEDFTISEPASAISVSGIVTDIICHGTSTGSIVLTVAGGTEPYTYSWTNGFVEKDQMDLLAGSYEVTVTDANGCASVEEYIISETTSAISILENVTDINCYGTSTGSITLTVAGGTEPYGYNWTNGSTEKDQAGLSAGSYALTLTDANACTKVEEYTLSEPASALIISAAVTDASCHGSATGSIVLTVTGGTSAYSYSWSNGSVEKNQSGLTTGTYEVTVTDANACTVVEEFAIAEPASDLIVTGTVYDSDCLGSANGNIMLLVEGGTHPYGYSWSNGSTEKNQLGVKAGLYEVLVSDSKGCQDTWSGEVYEKAKASLSGTVQFSGGFVAAEEADVVLYDASSHPYGIVSTVRVQPEGVFEFSQIPAGQYIVYVKLDNHAHQKYKGVMHTYYKEAHIWKDAKAFNISCEESYSLTVDMFENPAATNGKGKVSGMCTYDNGGVKAEAPPVTGVVVILIDADSGLPVDYVETDAEGYYEFTEIADGNYLISVDIPGIDQNSSHKFSIDATSLFHQGLDYEVDIITKLIISAIDNSPNDVNSLTDGLTVDLFPNPARDYITLKSAAFEDKNVKISIYTEKGQLLRFIETRPMANRIGQIELELGSIESGNYLIRIELDEKIIIKRFIVVK